MKGGDQFYVNNPTVLVQNQVVLDKLSLSVIISVYVGLQDLLINVVMTCRMARLSTVLP